MAKLVTRTALAERLGVSPQTISNAVADGRIKKGVSTSPDGAKMFKPLIAEREYLATTKTAKARHVGDDFVGRLEICDPIVGTPDRFISDARKAAADADIAEIKLAQMREELVPAADVASAWGKIIANTRAKILSLPSKAKGRIPHLSIAEIGILDALVYEALEELAEEDMVEDG